MNALDPKKREPGPFELLRQPPARHYLFLALAALVVYFILMSDRTQGLVSGWTHNPGLDLGTLLTLIVTIPGLIGRWTISPALFLILATYLLIDPNFERLLWGISRRHRHAALFDNVMLAASILIYLMAQYRLQSLLHKSMPDDPPPRRTGQPEPVTPRRSAVTYADREIGALLLVALGSVIVGSAGWFSISEFENGQRLGGIWGIQRPFAQLMLFFWGFMSASTLAIVFFRHRALRQMSRPAARLMLQDMFWAETRREQERIHRWRRWHRNRRTHAPDVERS